MSAISTAGVNRISYQDYIPFVSTVRSLNILFERFTSNIRPPAKSFPPCHILSPDSELRYMMLLIPGFGNLVVGLFDTVWVISQLGAPKMEKAVPVQASMQPPTQHIYLNSYQLEENLKHLRLKLEPRGSWISMQWITDRMWINHRETQLQDKVRQEMQVIMNLNASEHRICGSAPTVVSSPPGTRTQDCYLSLDCLSNQLSNIHLGLKPRSGGIISISKEPDSVWIGKFEESLHKLIRLEVLHITQ
ncbi:MAG: hypothetical protein V4492_04905, partial [Chlamydiota bacterium]